MNTLRLKELLYDLQELYLLSARGLLGIFRKPFYFNDTLEQMDYAGAGSFFIIVLVSLFVGISIIRELGPMVVALVYTGRVGAGIASELGSMVLGHQVDTLRVFGVDPVKKLVTPRIISSLIMLPVLTIIGDLISLLGSYYIAVFISHQSGTFFWSSIRQALTFENVFSGSFKPFIFGLLITCICCFMGLSTRGGSQGLRRATTQAVVFSIIMIIVFDFVLTRILLYALGFSI